jgi:hypothetical protein
VDKRLQELAEQAGVSVNSLVNKALRKFTDYDSYAEKFGIGIGIGVAAIMIDQLPEEEVKLLGQKASNVVKEMTIFRFKRLSVENLLEMLRFASIYGFLASLGVEFSSAGEEEVIIIQHRRGSKWSIFYENLLRSCFDGLDREIDVERTDNQVVMRLRHR